MHQFDLQAELLFTWNTIFYLKGQLIDKVGFSDLGLVDISPKMNSEPITSRQTTDSFVANNKIQVSKMKFGLLKTCDHK